MTGTDELLDLVPEEFPGGQMPLFPVLIVEDDPERIRWFEQSMPSDFRPVFVQSAGRALGLIERDSYQVKRRHVFGAIFLDCDLDMQTVMRQEHDLTGRDVVDAIFRHISKQIPVLVHSMNPKDAPHMVNKLRTAGFEVTRHPYADLTAEQLKEWLEDALVNWEDLHDT